MSNNYYKYIKYQDRYILLKRPIIKGVYIIGKINNFEGSGGTRAINIYKNNILIGMVICSPYYLYGKFKPSTNIILDVRAIEEAAYTKFTNNY